MARSAKKWPVFICYRQIDGAEAADEVATLLDGETVTVRDAETGRDERFDLVVYQDKNAVTGGDWTKIHKANLERARAFIMICTAAASIDHRKKHHNDWVQHEIDWWLEHRPEIAPIMIDAMGAEGLYVPASILEKWPNVQRTQLIASEWRKLRAAELSAEKSRIKDLLKGEVTRSRQEFISQELAEAAKREKDLEEALKKEKVAVARQQRNFKIAVALGCVAAVFALSALAFGISSANNADLARKNELTAQENETAAKEAEKKALKAKRAVDKLIGRINIAGATPEGKSAFRKICDEAVSVTRKIAVSQSPAAETAEIQRFRELYFGPMNMIEIRQQIKSYRTNVEDIVNSDIESTMVAFDRALKSEPIPNSSDLENLSKNIGLECDKFLGSRG
ncbi:MAG: hypothetical protein AAF441_18460 [Pseudomonadota bacterium]